MKKELKKLQKFRDQIKGWLAESAIKDKNQLNEYKRKIEIDMERFKAVERSSKTKAFSKHGLERSENETSDEKQRRETKEWMATCVEELSNQCDAFEAEIELLQSEGGKGKKGRNKGGATGNDEKVAKLEQSLARHKAHTLNLEIMMRLVENETLTCDDADDVRDLIEDYLERNQEDFEDFDDVGEMYENLNLEDLASKDAVKVVTNVKELHEETMGDSSAGQAQQPPPSPTPLPSTPPPPQQLVTALSGGAGSKILEPPKPRVVPPPSPKASAAAASAAASSIASQSSTNSTATMTNATTTAAGAASEQQNVNQWGSRFPAPKGLDADGGGNGGNNAAVGSSSSSNNNSSSAKPIPRPNNNVNNVVKDGNAAQQAFPPGPRPLSSDANQQQSAAEAASAAFAAGEVFDNPNQGVRSLNEMSSALRRGLSGTATAQTAVNSTLQQQQQQQQIQQQQQQQQQRQQQQQQSQVTRSTSTVAHGDPSSRLRLLEASASARLLPSANDGAWTRRVRRPPQAIIPPSYPTSLTDSNGNNLYPVLENPLLFERLDADALFFSFYHQQNTPQQYLAARELKRANWRFHKKYSAWFARRDEPKISNEEFEQGAYIFFDHAVTRDEFGSAVGWCQRSKPDFMFEYSHLENELV